MEFRIADTFTDSLAKLNNEEQKAVKITAFDLQMNPANPGLQFHKVETDQPVPEKPLLFTGLSDDDLLGYGIPTEWLHDVRAANEDSVLELADHLPSEAAEALLDLATGVTPEVTQPCMFYAG